MILFLLLNIFLLNIELFSAEQRFLHPLNTVAEQRIVNADLIIEAININTKEKNQNYKIPLLGTVSGTLVSYITGMMYMHNEILQISTRTNIFLQEIKEKRLKTTIEPLIIKNLTDRLNMLKSKNKTLKKYILGGFIIIILSYFLLKYSNQKETKRFKNNLKIALDPKTANLWNALFTIEKENHLNKKFFTIIDNAEQEENINKRINFLKKIIHIRELIEKTNKSPMFSEEEKTNILKK